MRRKGLKRRRVPESLDDVREEVHRLLSEQTPGGEDDFSDHADRTDALLAAVSEFDEAWTLSPYVHRVALLDTRIGVVPFEDGLALPDIKHTYELMLEMLAHRRQSKGLPPVGMPVFLYPDDVTLALTPVEPVRPEDVLASLPEKEISPIAGRRRKRLLKQRDMTETRRAVLDRDDWECRKCSALKDLELYRVDDTLDEYDCEAYVTLCPACLPATSRTLVYRGHEVTPEEVRGIRSQLALVFNQASLERVGIVLGSDYTVLKA